MNLKLQDASLEVFHVDDWPWCASQNPGVPTTSCHTQHYMASHVSFPSQDQLKSGITD